MRKIGFFFLGLGLATSAYSQTTGHELIGSAGDCFTGTGYQLDWSIGESVTSTFSDESYLLAQGFQQHVYTVGTIVEDPATGGPTFSLYPNPVTGHIFLQIEGELPDGLRYKLFDIKGVMLIDREMFDNPVSLDLSAFANGTYLLSVEHEQRLFKSFRIVKADPGLQD